MVTIGMEALQRALVRGVVAMVENLMEIMELGDVSLGLINVLKNSTCLL